MAGITGLALWAAGAGVRTTRQSASKPAGETECPAKVA